MKRILFTLCLVSAMNMFGAGLSITKNEEVATADKVYHPMINPQGDKLIYSSEDYCGIKLMNLKSRESAVISTDEGAGYRPQIDVNGNVYYRTVKVVDRLRNENLMQWNCTTKAKKEIIPMNRDNMVVAEVKGNVRLKSPKLSTVKYNETIVYSEEGEIMVEGNGKHNVLNPVPGATCYLWPSLSPDGTQILYVEPHHGVYVCNIDGSNNRFLGKGSLPMWMDNNYIALLKTSDDGYIILSARLYAMNIATKNTIALSDESIKVDDATVAPMAKKLAYTSMDGKLYIVEYQIAY